MLLAAAIPLAPHVARGCELDRIRRVSDPEETVAKAERCAAGDVGACRALDWVAGAGPSDLRDLPDGLAASVERILSRLCEAKDDVACSNRGRVLVRLGRADDALALYRGRCESDWPSCLAAAEIAVGAGHLEEALPLFSRVCDAAHDGDAGASCTCAGELLERLSRPASAREVYARGCAHGDDEACAAAGRLSGRKPREGGWDGLYRSASGTLLVEDEGGGRISVRMSTRWANGHTCRYSGEGATTGDSAQLEGGRGAGEGCRPILRRTGRKVSVVDPGDACRSAACGARGSFEETFERDDR